MDRKRCTEQKTPWQCATSIPAARSLHCDQDYCVAARGLGPLPACGVGSGVLQLQVGGDAVGKISVLRKMEGARRPVPVVRLLQVKLSQKFLFILKNRSSCTPVFFSVILYFKLFTCRMIRIMIRSINLQVL